MDYSLFFFFFFIQMEESFPRFIYAFIFYLYIYFFDKLSKLVFFAVRYAGIRVCVDFLCEFLKPAAHFYLTGLLNTPQFTSLYVNK